MGGNGVNFNAPKDTTGVNRVNTQNILRAVGQGALKGGINCIFTHGKGSTGNVDGKVERFGYDGSVKYSGVTDISGSVHWEVANNIDEEFNVTGDAHYEGDVSVEGKID